jgi:tetratricopeptide (TPR) repeat protein
VAFDRDTTLRKGEKLLRQGRLDLAILEYLKVIEDQPRDWNTANILGDLFARAGLVDKAIGQYTKIGDHLFEEGFFSRAAAVYKKILKLKSDEEHALLQLAESAAKQGLLADAKSALAGLLEQRQRRGDRAGAVAIRMRLGSLDPGNLEARLAGARAAAEIGETPTAVNELKAVADEFTQRGRFEDAVKLLAEAAKLGPGDPEIASSLIRACIAKGDFEQARQHAKTAAQFKEIASDLHKRGQQEQALDALAEAAALDPADRDTRALLARTYVSRGDPARARQYLTREVAGDDVQLLWMLAELELRAGQTDEGLSILQDILRAHPEQRDQLVLLGCAVADVSVDTAYQVVDLAAADAIENDQWADAAAALNEFVNREPGHIPALMRLVEICVDGGLEATMASAQAQLADAYLAAGCAAEARVIAEDLVAREPWDRTNLERFRRALAQLGEDDIDAIIAERLSGQTPFVSIDLFPAFAEDVIPDKPGKGAESAAVPAAPPPSPASTPTAPAFAADPDRPGALESVEPAAAPVTDGAFDLETGNINITVVDQARMSEGGASDNADIGEVDLSNVIEELRPSMVDAKSGPRKEPAKDLEGVFKDFREEVTRENLADAATQHFKLAVTYQDMGMIDDAVKALEVAVRAPRLRFAAASMLARIFLKRSAPAQAIEWFERAAEAPAPDPEAGRGLLYELADTLESQGETARALAVFLELQADVGDYRDLSARLERLTKVQLRR